MVSTPQGWMLGASCLDSVDDRFVRNRDVDVEWERAKAQLLPEATREEWTRAFVADRVGKGDSDYIIRAQTRQSHDYPKGPIIGYTSPISLNVG